MLRMTTVNFSYVEIATLSLAITRGVVTITKGLPKR